MQVCYQNGDISYELCCHSSFGPEGNSACWDETRSFQRCCSEGQRELATTEQWEAHRMLHNAHLAVQLDKNPRCGLICGEKGCEIIG